LLVLVHPGWRCCLILPHFCIAATGFYDHIPDSSFLSFLSYIFSLAVTLGVPIEEIRRAEMLPSKDVTFEKKFTERAFE
jgi:hypothetical protein